MSEGPELASYLTPDQVAALVGALGDGRCSEGGGSRAALTPPGPVELRAKITCSAPGFGDKRVEDWLCSARYPRNVSIDKLLSHFRRGLRLDIECFPGECLFRGEDGKYYTVGHDIGVGEDCVGFIRQQVESDIRWAEQEGNHARVKAMRGRLALLESRARLAGETDCLRPAARPFYFTGAESSALAGFLAGGSGDWARGGPLASARAKLARALPAGDDLVLEWAAGDWAKDCPPFKAGQVAKDVRKSVEEKWQNISLEVFLTEDGGFYSLAEFIDVVEACPRYARGLVEGEMQSARERGDDARVEALKGHLEALASLAASEEKASADEVAVVPTA